MRMPLYDILSLNSGGVDREQRTRRFYLQNLLVRQYRSTPKSRREYSLIISLFAEYLSLYGLIHYYSRIMVQC